jgi:hypothetical protein
MGSPLFKRTQPHAHYVIRGLGPDMPFYPQCRVLHKGEYRLYERMRNLTIINSAIVIAGNYLTTGTVDQYAPGASRSTIECNQLDIAVVVPIYGCFEAALLNIRPEIIHVHFHERVQAPPGGYSVWAAGINHAPPSFGLVLVVARMMTPIFGEFYESYAPWVKNKFGDPDNWPMVWNFARIVRNAISHGEELEIRNPNAKTVSWYGLSYSHADNGKRIFGFQGADLTPGDMIVLMFELSDALDEAGCQT